MKPAVKVINQGKETFESAVECFCEGLHECLPQYSLEYLHAVYKTAHMNVHKNVCVIVWLCIITLQILMADQLTYGGTSLIVLGKIVHALLNSNFRHCLCI